MSCPRNEYDRPIICTITTGEFLAQAHCLLDSFSKHHPGGLAFVLYLDDVAAVDELRGDHAVSLRLSDLAIAEISAMRSRYNTFELCNALKPFLLQHLMSHTEYRKFCYFDSDIYIFSPLQGDVWDELDSCAVLLTPHLCEFPDNNLELLWRDLAVLQHGVYNGGFIGIRRCPEAQELLRWWASRLIEGGYKNLAKGMNCDQRWLDLVPGFAPSVRICRHAGVNAAYWNMHERHFKTVDGQHSVNGQQLRFFHFSGYSHVDSGAITKNWTKFTFENRPDVKPIFDEYRKHFDSISKLAATTTRHARGPEAAPRSPRKSSLIKALAQRLRSGWTNNLYRRRP